MKQKLLAVMWPLKPEVCIYFSYNKHCIKIPLIYHKCMLNSAHNIETQNFLYLDIFLISGFIYLENAL